MVGYYGKRCFELKYGSGRLYPLLGRKKNASMVQIALAWITAQRPWIVPIPGTTQHHHVVENIGASAIDFSPAELEDFNFGLDKIILNRWTCGHFYRKPDRPLGQRFALILKKRHKIYNNRYQHLLLVRRFSAQNI